MTDPEIKERLRALVAESVEACGREPIEPIADDDFLPSFLDSVVLSALLVLMEEEWSFQVADEEIEPEIFESVESLAVFVEGKRS